MEGVPKPSEVHSANSSKLEGFGRKRAKDSDMSRQSTPSQTYPGADLFWGTCFTIFGFISVFGFFYAAILSKLLPPSENRSLAAIQNDRYYCLLVPLTLPVLVVAVYLHWLSMKLFKHA